VDYIAVIKKKKKKKKKKEQTNQSRKREFVPFSGEPQKANLLNSTSGSQLCQPQMHNSSISLHSEAQEIRPGLSAQRAAGVALFGEFGPSAAFTPMPLQPPPQQTMGATGTTSNKHATTVSSVGDDDSRMLDDEEEKRQGPLTIGKDQFLSPLQQLKALFNKLDAESKQRRWIPTGRTHRKAHHGVLSTNDPFSIDSGSGGAPIEPTGQATVGQRSVRPSSDALFGRANCLVLDTKQLSADQQTAVEARAAGFFFCLNNSNRIHKAQRSYKISLTTCALAQRGEFGLPKEGGRGGKSPMEGEARKRARKSGMKQSNKPKRRSGNAKYPKVKQITPNCGREGTRAPQPV
jgi:hypothetical protein